LRISRSPAVAVALDQHVEDLALVIDGTPEIHPLAGDPHHREAEIQPDRVLDNRRRKAVAAVGEQSHGARLSYSPLALTPFL
jgi:hypothetical protein